MANKFLSQFALARTALKYGLNTLKLHAGDGILVPDYICDVVWYPIQQVGLKVVTYPLTDTFVPDWDAIKVTLLNESVVALLMVHYFGQPQNLERYRTLCYDYDLWLIEDNAHGHSGRLHGQLLGTFGDIGISSPRKILGLPYGGILYYHSNCAIQIDKTRQLRPYKIGHLLQALKTGLNYFPQLKGRLNGVRNNAKNWSDPLLFRESPKPDYLIDSSSQKHIASVDWQITAHRRRTVWNKWANFVSRNGMKPVFSSVHPESCPWVLPVYAQNLDERNHWLKWGSKHGVNIFPWPTLRNEIVNEDGPAFARWKRLLCFPLDVSP